MGFLLKEERDNSLVEYNFLSEEIWERSYRTWVFNAILIIGSVLVAFLQVQTIIPTPILSLVLVISGLVLHVSSEKENEIKQKRMEEIALSLRITELTKFQKAIEQKWWFSAKKNLPYALFIVLSAIYLLLITNNYYVLAATIIVGFLAIYLLQNFKLTKTKTEQTIVPQATTNSTQM
jgi:hypothetical protein